MFLAPATSGHLNLEVAVLTLVDDFTVIVDLLLKRVREAVVVFEGAVRMYFFVFKNPLQVLQIEQVAVDLGNGLVFGLYLIHVENQRVDNPVPIEVVDHGFSNWSRDYVRPQRVDILKGHRGRTQEICPGYVKVVGQNMAQNLLKQLAS